jgi:3-oxoacid CoA-transferase subunit B
MSLGWSKNEMADQVVALLKPGSSVNLGIGMPTIVAERIPQELNIVIHSENGVLGIDGRPTKDTVSPTLINAGKETVSVGLGASFFDSSLSFGMIRGGHIDYCVLGGMEVDSYGSLANWMVPGKKITGMGGAMDLVNGAKSVIVMLSHFNPDGKSKLVDKCTLPLTGLEVVNYIVTELGVFKPAHGRFDILRLADGVGESQLGFIL